MKVSELRGRMEKAPDGDEVVVEAENGQKFSVLTAKTRGVRVGHKSGSIFWIATGKQVEWRDVG